jgi:DNA mismatch repair protein MutS2
VPPTDDTAEQLTALRELIEETRREVNARLDALAAAVEALVQAPARSASVRPNSPPVAPSTTAPSTPVPSAIQGIKVGDEVYVPHLGATYRVVEIGSSGEQLKVQVGHVKVQVRRSEVWSLDDAQSQAPRPPPRGAQKPTQPATPRKDLNLNIPEIDLHGYSEADALITLELFLHHAITHRMPRIRIIHGKGNGILREAVRRELAHKSYVRKVDVGPHYRGDDGVTLAELDV